MRYTEPLKFFEQLASVLILIPAGFAKFLFAEHEGDVLSTMLLITFGNRVTYLYRGVSNHKRNLMDGEAVKTIGAQTIFFLDDVTDASKMVRQRGGALS
jgi:hypothetical protein